jgi:hypothetical protein
MEWTAAVARTLALYRVGATPRSLEPGAVGRLWDYMGLDGSQWSAKDFHRVGMELRRPNRFGLTPPNASFQRDEQAAPLSDFLFASES